jgi:hypothetical protein
MGLSHQPSWGWQEGSWGPRPARLRNDSEGASQLLVPELSRDQSHVPVGEFLTTIMASVSRNGDAAV